MIAEVESVRHGLQNKHDEIWNRISWPCATHPRISPLHPQYCHVMSHFMLQTRRRRRSTKRTKRDDVEKVRPLTHRPIPPFVKSLWRMVSDETEPASCITWTEDGRAFVIHDRDKFATEVLPKFFKHSNFTSFTRQVREKGEKCALRPLKGPDDSLPRISCGSPRAAAAFSLPISNICFLFARALCFWPTDEQLNFYRCVPPSTAGVCAGNALTFGTLDETCAFESCIFI